MGQGSRIKDQGSGDNPVGAVIGRPPEAAGIEMQNAKCKMQNEANPAAPAICRPDVPFVGAVIGRPPEAAGIEMQNAECKMQNEANPAAPAICRPDLPFVGAVIGRPPEAAGDGGRQSAVPTEGVPAPALAAIKRLRAAGYEAYLVGGCVRDALLGREPGDWDITTAALPEQTEAVFAGERVIETGLKHGTVTVLLGAADCVGRSAAAWGQAALQAGNDKDRTVLPLEITTFRTEAGYSDHRHPDAVAFTSSLTEDLARRDFTINAMAWAPEDHLIRHRACGGRPMPPSPQGEGFERTVPCVPCVPEGLVDPFGGRADLENKVIRCVGDPYARFNEDALRILRALRFASQLGFALDPATAAAAYELRQTLDLVSRERVAVELTKLLCGPDARRILTEYWEILAVPLPELAPMAGLDQRCKYHCYDVLEHSAAAVEAVPPEKLLRWAALLHDVGKPACFTLDEAGCGHFRGHAKAGAPMAREILTRLRFDKDTVNRVSALVELHDYPIDPPVEAEGSRIRDQGSGNAGSSIACPPSYERAVRRLIGKLGEEDFFRLLDLKRADALAHHPDYRGRTAACDRLEALARELLAQPPCFTVKDLAINGNDLLALGFPKGPEIGKALNALLEAVLSGELPNEREALLEAVRISKK